MIEGFGWRDAIPLSWSDGWLVGLITLSCPVASDEWNECFYYLAYPAFLPLLVSPLSFPARGPSHCQPSSAITTTHLPPPTSPMDTSRDLPDILIVGAGIFGVSTAYHLAQQLERPSQIVLLDRAAPPSTPAASTDINKIIRADYTNPLYVALGFEAIEAWKSLPFFQDAQVYHPSGWIAMEETDSDVPALIRKNFRDYGRGDVFEEWTEEQVRHAWGGLLEKTDCSPFGSYYYNSSAGWAEAGKALQLMAQEAIKLGVRYEVGEARRIVRDEQGVSGIKTADGTIYPARKVLLATGAWTSQLMSSVEDDLDLPEPDRVERQVSAAGVTVSHFQLSSEEKSSYSQLPVFVYGGQGGLYPGLAWTS